MAIKAPYKFSEMVNGHFKYILKYLRSRLSDCKDNRNQKIRTIEPRYLSLYLNIAGEEGDTRILFNTSSVLISYFNFQREIL